MKKNDEDLKWIHENFEYIDSLTAIDDTGKIIVKKRFNPRYSDEENKANNEWAVGRNLLDVFPSLSYENSSLLQSIQQPQMPDEDGDPADVLGCLPHLQGYR